MVRKMARSLPPSVAAASVSAGIDRREAERKRDQRQRHEEDGVGDDRGPRLAIESGRGPEGEEAERGDDGRQHERRDAEQLEDPRPRRRSPPQEPRKRQRDRDRQRRRGEREDDGRDERAAAIRDRGTLRRTRRAKSPAGGKVRFCFSLIETPATTTIGAARKTAMATKNRRAKKRFTRRALSCCRRAASAR